MWCARGAFSGRLGLGWFLFDCLGRWLELEWRCCYGGEERNQLESESELESGGRMAGGLQKSTIQQ